MGDTAEPCVRARVTISTQARPVFTREALYLFFVYAGFPFSAPLTGNAASVLGNAPSEKRLVILERAYPSASGVTCKQSAGGYYPPTCADTRRSGRYARSSLVPPPCELSPMLPDIPSLCEKEGSASASRSCDRTTRASDRTHATCIELQVPPASSSLSHEGIKRREGSSARRYPPGVDRREDSVGSTSRPICRDD